MWLLFMLLSLGMVAVIERLVRLVRRSRLYSRWMHRRGYVWLDDPSNARLGAWVKTPTG
jgi:hypothetical protein